MIWILIIGGFFVFVVAILLGKSDKNNGSNCIDDKERYRSLTSNDIAKINQETNDSLKRLKRYGVDHELERLKAENEVWRRKFSYLMELQGNGEICEKNGDISKAIEFYEQCVNHGRSSSDFMVNNYFRSIERLVILYRKTKQIDKEIALIEQTINADPDYSGINKLRERLLKAIEIRGKVKQKGLN